MASGKEIKGRIKSIRNTGKITKAMELISTVKMKRSQESVLELRPFAAKALEILQTIARDEDIFATYTKSPKTKQELLVVIASQKGLCGGYNVNIFKHLIQYIRKDYKKSPIDTYEYISIGKRAREFILGGNQTIIADFSDTITDPVDPAETRKLVRFLLDAWKSQKYAKISIIYNHYVSTIVQEPIIKPLFPISKQDITDFLQKIVATYEIDEAVSAEPFSVEGDTSLLFEYVFPLILDSMVHETILEARASEHAARMVAMKNAKDAAKKKADLLTLIYNKARQSSITTEITEIVSGVESMKD